MSKARRLASGSWRCQATYTDEDGMQHRASFTEDSAKVAEAKAAMWKAGMIERDLNKKQLPLGDAMDEYIASCRVAKRSVSTIRGYVAMRNGAYDLLIKKPVDHIALRDVQRWVNARAQAVAPKTLRNNLNFLSAVLAANETKIDFDSLKLPEGERVEMEIPSDKMVSALLDLVYDEDDMFIACSLAALMGLRRSEICALHWTDIQATDGVATLVVDKALVRDEHGKYVEKTTKTDAGKRTLVIPDALYEELKRRRNLRTNIVSVTPDALTNRYAVRIKKLDFPKRFHNLRHYHASVMLREGVPEKYIVADMGHSSFDMVKRVYGHIMQEKRNLIDKAMNTHATGILNRAHGDAHEIENC